MLLGMLAVVLSYCGTASAVLSSPSFRVFGDDLNLLAGNAGSASFAVRDCLGPGPEAAGEASSASFKVQIGCVAALNGLPADDDDGDGASNGAENGAPNNGDGNGDMIADSTQGNIASVPAASGSGYLTIEIPADGPCGQLLDVQAVDPRTLGDGDRGFTYPFGMIRFRIEPCSGPVAVTLYLHGPGGSVVDTYRKFGRMAPDYASPRSFYTLPGATFGTATVGMETVRTVSFTLADNALGDDSPVMLRIVDPSGPALQTVNRPVPVLAPGGLAACVLLLLAVAALQLRRARLRCGSS